MIKLVKIDMQPLRDLNDNRAEFVYLVDMCKKVLANPSLYPKQILHIARRYLNNGGNTMYEYDYLVNTLIDNADFRRELLKWKIMN